MVLKPRVLVVDDDPIDLKLVRLAAGKTKSINDLKLFEDAEQALAFLRSDSWKPHLIVTDLNMPRMNGFELIQELKGDVVLQTIPILVLTTSSSAKDIKQAYSLRANGYVTKPSDVSEYSIVWDTIESFWLKVAQNPTE